ncbi:MAG TPA: hypothetical protein VFV10_04280 [Gammaproteobacteria bacterium]|nr:hypothetical protein [Gammaproteobacteria bacterium]
MPFADDVDDVGPLAHHESETRRAVAVELRGPERALLRALMLRTGLNESEILRVALLGLASPRRRIGREML